MPQNQKVVSGSYDLLELYHRSVPLHVLHMYAKKLHCNFFRYRLEPKSRNCKANFMSEPKGRKW